MPEDFHVEITQCMACGAPPLAAPTLMEMQDYPERYPHCQFKRQPVTAAEIDEAAAGIWSSCCGAVQYRGSDPYTLSRIKAIAEECTESAKTQQSPNSAS
jgi:hypothetical protein